MSSVKHPALGPPAPVASFRCRRTFLRTPTLTVVWLLALTSSIVEAAPSAPSHEAAGADQCSAPPAPPSGFAVTQGPGGNPVHFSWSPPTVAVDGYQLEAGGAPGQTFVSVPLGGLATSFVVHAPPGTFFVRLRAQNACGLSPPSNEVIVTVGSGCVAPSAPTLTATVTGSAVTLVWSPASTGTPPYTYTLLGGSSPGSSNLATVPMGALTFFQGSVPAGTYYVRVVASNSCGTSVPSNEAIVIVGPAAGVPVLTFTITPNPVPFYGWVQGVRGRPSPTRSGSTFCGSRTKAAGRSPLGRSRRGSPPLSFRRRTMFHIPRGISRWRSGRRPSRRRGHCRDCCASRGTSTMRRWSGRS